MTNQEALLASINYPFDINKIKKVCIDRELDLTGDYGDDTQSFELAKADLIMLIVTTPNITEGGFTISVTEKQILINMAKEIYLKYNETIPVSTIPKVSNKSYLW